MNLNKVVKSLFSLNKLLSELETKSIHLSPPIASHFSTCLNLSDAPHYSTDVL